MKVSQLLDAMLEWMALLSEQGGSPEKRAAMGSFVELLRGHETKTVAVLAGKLKGLPVPAQNEGNGAVRINTLAEQFKSLSRFCKHIKATAAANDFDSIAAALLQHGTASVGDFYAVAKIGLAERSRTAPRVRPVVDPSLISTYVHQFRNVVDEAEFERAKKVLEKDGAINKITLSQIVNEVSGHVGAFANKKEAFEVLRSAFIEQARFRNKLGPKGS